MARFDGNGHPTPPDDGNSGEVCSMNKIRRSIALGLIVVGFAMLAADSAWAAEPPKEAGPAVQAHNLLGDPGMKGIGAGIGAGLVIMGGAAGIGRIGGSAVESMARQPESAGSINFAMIVTAAMIEGATLFAVVVCLLAIVL
jgi:F-type H+-transporting ATPase subunit c